jgi:hypothetical protein
MLTLNDIDVIENNEEASEEDYYYSIQKAINSGSAWSFQGLYGRAMMDAIKAGYCMLGRDQARDYYGNIIPSRDDVKPSTQGSYEYVIKCAGLAHAESMLEA